MSIMRTWYISQMSRWLITMGAVLLMAGLLIWGYERLSLPKLPKMPGDVLIQRKNWTVYAPLGTSLVVSVVLTILLNLFLGRRR